MPVVGYIGLAFLESICRGVNRHNRVVGLLVNQAPARRHIRERLQLVGGQAIQPQSLFHVAKENALGGFLMRNAGARIIAANTALWRERGPLRPGFTRQE